MAVPENKNVPNSGLSPRFNLSDSIGSVALPTDQPPENPEDIFPIAVLAADKVMGDFHDKVGNLEHEVSHDHLTGLLNQTAYMERFSETIKNLNPGEDAVAYVADLDGFKAVNDALSHSSGDELLGIVGNVFKQVFKRESDSVGHGSREATDYNIARLGGDEFSAFTIREPFDGKQRSTSFEDEADYQSARLNELLQKELVGTKFEPFPINLSVGSALRGKDEDAQSLFARADLKMFEVKYNGKISKLTDEDKEQLRIIIPYLESKGARIESWLKQGAGLLKAA